MVYKCQNLNIESKHGLRNGSTLQITLLYAHCCARSGLRCTHSKVVQEVDYGAHIQLYKFLSIAFIDCVLLGDHWQSEEWFVFITVEDDLQASSKGLGRPAICGRHSWTPLKKLLARIILVAYYFYEAQAVFLLTKGSSDCWYQFSFCWHLRHKMRGAFSDAACFVMWDKRDSVKLTPQESIVTFVVQTFPSPLWIASTNPV